MGRFNTYLDEETGPDDRLKTAGQNKKKPGRPATAAAAKEKSKVKSILIDKKKPTDKKKKGNPSFGHKNSQEWWDSLTAEKQEEWLRANPKGEVAQNVNAGKWTRKSQGEKEKGKEDKTVPPKPGKPGRNAKGEPDFTGTGIHPDKGHMTPDQLKQDELDTEKAKKDMEKQQKERERIQKELHDKRLHSKFGRLIASPEETEELDKERDAKEKEEEKKEKAKKEGPNGGKSPGVKGGPKYETKIAGKDKSLDSKIDTSKQKAFTTTLYDNKKGDDAFYKKAKNYSGKDLEVKEKWNTPSWLLSSGKVPVREVQIFTRMMNTKMVSSTEPPISFFTDGGAGGAGKIQAQAGELMTMMCASMSKDEKKEFEKSVKDHIATSDEKKSIITKDWLKAAVNNSNAIHARIEKEFGVEDASSIITHSCWDTKDDVEALGLKDYNKNKGFSSDIYIKLKLPNGQTVLNEISLKKDKNVNFLNSSTGKFKTWDKNLPSDIDPVVYSTLQRKNLSSNIDKNAVHRLLRTSNTPKVAELKDMLAKNKVDNIDKFISGNNREARKVLLTALGALAENGDKKAEKALKDVDGNSRKYALNAIKAISTNANLKKGMLDEVKSEFPLKAVTENEETMAIGDMSVDKKTIKEIFGTDKWDDIQEHLTAITDKEPPFLAYKAKGKKDIIPIATIAVREDGVGYGSQFKFEMKLDTRFATILKKANMKLYSSEGVNESMLYKWMLEYNIEEDD